MRRITINQARPGMVVGQAVIASDGEMLLSAGMELIPSFITSLRQRGYTSLVIDDDATKGINVPETISSEIRAAATRQLRGTFSAFDRATADLKGKSTSQIEKGLGSRTFADQAKEIDPYAAMVESIQGMIDDLLKADALDGLNAVKIHDDHTFEHSINVAATALMIGKQLQLDQRQLRMLGLGALVHDVGKMFVDKEIIQKPGKLTGAEWAKMAAHPRMGYLMLRESGSPHDLLAHHVAYQHHEHHDGSGYPRGLTGTAQMFRRGGSRQEGHVILPIAARARSRVCQRAKGTPRVRGKAQASALTCTTTSGGKRRRAAAAQPVRQAGQSLLEEPLASLRHDLARGVQAGGDRKVAQTSRRQEHDPSPDHLPVR